MRVSMVCICFVLFGSVLRCAAEGVMTGDSLPRQSMSSSAASHFLMYSTSDEALMAGELSGRFAINGSGGYVHFSQGNLLKIKVANRWQFASEQTAYIGLGNIANGIFGLRIDLFGFSSDYKLIPEYGDNSTTADEDYAGAFVDWGGKAIYNGGMTADVWSTLSAEEWEYVLNGRAHAQVLRGYTMVGDVSGLVLLPDTSTQTVQSSYTSSSFATAESLGAVFLPFAGQREGFAVKEVGTVGYYWSSTTSGDDGAYRVVIGGEQTPVVQAGARHYGYAVRLVRRYEEECHAVITVDTDTPEGGTVGIE